MKRNRRLERKRREFQYAGTVFFAGLLLIALWAGLRVNPHARAAADKPVVENTYIVTITATTENEEPDTVVQTATTGTVELPKLYYDVPLSTEMQDYIFGVAEQYGVPAEVIIAIIGRESNYCPTATGSAGEQGYMQIHPINHEWLSETLGITDYYDPEQNILAGTYVLSLLFEKYDTVAEVLMCYNCGETGARRLWAQGVTETQYTAGVMQTINTLTLKEEV